VIHFDSLDLQQLFFNSFSPFFLQIIAKLKQGESVDDEEQ
jgi:hypothetical protein